MTNISSNATLFLKFGFPAFYLAFLGGAVMAFAVSEVKIAQMPKQYFLALLIVIFLLSALLMVMTVFRLKRVEIDEQGFFVSNYFKHRRYTLESVATLNQRDYLFFKIGTLVLHQKGAFGKRIPFIVGVRSLKRYLEEHPNVATQLQPNN